MPTLKYPSKIKVNPNQGGKAAIERLVEAYGFTTRQALADHLKISKSTLANRYLRDTFPSDWIIQCVLETGISLLWLTTGEGNKFIDTSNTILHLKNYKIVDGALEDGEFLLFDPSLIPSGLKEPVAVTVDEKIYIADTAFDDVTDGDWLVEIEGKFWVRTLTRIPVSKVKVSNENSFFECQLSDIKTIAKCHSVYIKKSR